MTDEQLLKAFDEGSEGLARPVGGRAEEQFAFGLRQVADEARDEQRGAVEQRINDARTKYHAAERQASESKEAIQRRAWALESEVRRLKAEAADPTFEATELRRVMAAKDRAYERLLASVIELESGLREAYDHDPVPALRAEICRLTELCTAQGRRLAVLDAEAAEKEATT